MITPEKKQLEPDTTLYPVPVVLVSCGTGEEANLFTLNRVASCNAEPPMVCIGVRPARASFALIEALGEFGINIPWPDMEILSDFVGSTSKRDTDKWTQTGLTPFPAARIRPELIAECPVNIECRVTQTVYLPSHGLFIAEVVALHADKEILDQHGKVDWHKAKGGLPYRAGSVRERPVGNLNPGALLTAVQDWKKSRD